MTAIRELLNHIPTRKDLKGNPALRAFQVRGGSESGEYVGWKSFHAEEMRGVSMLPDTFSGARPKYKKGDEFFLTIHCEL